MVTTVALAEAKARFSEMIERVEAGETIAITKRGRTVARLVADAPSAVAIDLADLRSLTEGMAPQPTSAGDMVRRMRDDARY